MATYRNLLPGAAIPASNPHRRQHRLRRPRIAAFAPVSWFYRGIIRPVLFAQEAEKIHDRTLRLLAARQPEQTVCLRVASTLYGAPELPVELFGLRFPNPVGLAAGMDKWARAVPAWAALGFGFSELGGVTWHAATGQSGAAPVPRVRPTRPSSTAWASTIPARRPSPKLWREWKQEARWPDHPVGVNLGKSKVTPLEDAAEDYANSFRVLRAARGFCCRQRQFAQHAQPAPTAGQSARWTKFSRPCRRTTPAAVPIPILVKVAPDLSFEALDEILELAGPRQMAGIVATNTTITRPETGDARLRDVYEKPGGLSGRPLRAAEHGGHPASVSAEPGSAADHRRGRDF